MLRYTWKQQYFSEFLVPGPFVSSPSPGSSRIHCSPHFITTQHLRYQSCSSFGAEVVTKFVSRGAHTWTGGALEKGRGPFGRQCTEIKSSVNLRAVAESQESHSSSDISVSGDENGESADEFPTLTENQRWIIVKKKISALLSNAQKLSQGIQQIRHSLAVDYGDSKTGLSISLRGYAPRPLTVVRMRGDKLIEQILEIAAREQVDEFIVGLPRSSDGMETEQSSKTRSFAGRLAGQAALRGWRVFLLDEYGSSQDGLNYMLEMGVKKRSRKEQIDAYAALVLLYTYFNSKGARAQLVVPKGLDAQEQLCLGSSGTKGEKIVHAKGYDLDDNDNYEYD